MDISDDQSVSRHSCNGARIPQRHQAVSWFLSVLVRKKRHERERCVVGGCVVLIKHPTYFRVMSHDNQVPFRGGPIKSGLYGGSVAIEGE